MMKRFYQFCAGILFVVLITACTSQEALVMFTITAPPSSHPPATHTPTLTAFAPTATVQPIPTDTMSAPTSVPAASQEDTAMIFIGETVPDGTNLQPGQAFRKTWTLKNGGTRAWTKGFALTVTASNPEGENLSSPETIPVGKVVQPGESMEISVDLVAPIQDGRYTVYYELKDETGVPVPDSQIWVTITVGSVPASGSASANGVSATLSNFVSNP